MIKVAVMLAISKSVVALLGCLMLFGCSESPERKCARAKTSAKTSWTKYSVNLSHRKGAVALSDPAIGMKLVEVSSQVSAVMNTPNPKEALVLANEIPKDKDASGRTILDEARAAAQLAATECQ